MNKLRRHLTRLIGATCAVGLLAGTAGAQVFHFPELLAGTPSSTQLVTVTVTVPGATIGSIQVLTQGSVSTDFTDVGGGSCALSQVLLGTPTCTVNVKLQPTYPGFHTGAVVLLDSAGNRIGVGYMDGLSHAPLGLIIPGIINSVAGNGQWTYVADGVAATDAPIFLPMGVAIDGAGNLFLSDSSNNRVRRIDAPTQTISTFAGNGSPGFSGDTGPATSAMVSNPSALVIDGAGNLYFADTTNNVIRMVDAVTHNISTIAGIGTQTGYSGDGALATAALLNQPSGLALDSARNLYIADKGNDVIRKLVLSTGIISTVAGTGVAGYTGDGGQGTSATLQTPWGLSVTPDGTLYIADLDNNVIRMLAPSGIITTVVGTGTQGFSGDGSSAQSATLYNPASVTVDVAGNIYIGDAGNGRIRKVNSVTKVISTIAGTAGEAAIQDGINSDAAGLYGPYALQLDGPGNLYIADMFHNRIRKISSNLATLAFPTMRVGRTSAPLPESLENDGNAVMTLLELDLVNAATDTATTSCQANQLLPTTVACSIGVEFAPTVTGTPASGTLTVKTDATNSPGVVRLSGIVLDVDPTTVTVTSSLNPSGVGQAVTFTAHITTTGTAAVTGTVQFFDGPTAISAVLPVDVSASATVTTSALTRGTHPITAVYSGDASNANSTSDKLNQLVKQITTLVLVSTPNPSIVSQSVTFTATLGGFLGTPTGTVRFFEGATTLGAVALSNTGTAVMNLTTLSPGDHIIFAVYASSDTNNLDSTSNTTTQHVSQAATATTLTTSAATVTVNTTVTFTSTVTSNGGPIPTGSVNFYDNGTTLIGSGVLTAGAGMATASFSTGSLAPAPATHSITAVFPGDTSNITSTSAPVIETIQQVVTTTTIASSANPSNAGAPLTLTSTVTGGTGSSIAGAITGSVTFMEGGVTLGTGTVSGTGVATISISTLTVGDHNLHAVYSGNTNYATSSSTPPLDQHIQQSTTTTAVTSNTNPVIAGKQVTFTATVSTVGGTPTGTVSFKDAGVIIGTTTLNAGGVAIFPTSTLSVGTHSISATYNHDDNNVASDSPAINQTVVIATTALQFGTSVNPAIAGANVTLTATLSGNGGQATGLIHFLDGGTEIGNAAINGAAPVSITRSNLTVGQHTLTAFYGGDANDSPITSVPIVESIQLATTTTSLASSLSPSSLGQSITFTANVRTNSPSLAPTGTITFQDGGATLATVPVSSNGSAAFSTSTLVLGNHTIVAVYSGDANQATSSSPAFTQQVLQATAISITSSVNPSIAGKIVTFTAVLPGATGVVPTGTVTFRDGGTVLGSSTISGGSASFSISTLTLGAHNITAAYGGDTNFQAITSAALTQTIRIADTNLVLTSSANPAISGAAIAFTATITGTGGAITGTITYLDGTATIGRATLNGNGVAVFSISTLSPGIHSISALYSGDANNSPNSSGVLQQQVQQVTRTTLASNANPSLTLDPITLTSTVVNGGTQPATGLVTFTEGSLVLGAVALNGNGVATLTLPSLAAGAHSIIATYAGDVPDLPSASATLVQTVQLRATTTTLTAVSTSLTDGQQLTLISAVRWTGPVTPTGIVTFTYGGTLIGTSVVDKTGVATLTILLNLSKSNVVATYSGDPVYSTSSSVPTPIAPGPATQFSLDMSKYAVSLKSKEHTTIDLTLTSVNGYNDTMSLGCLGLPFAATCTFSTDQAKLAANGKQTVHLVIDTGSPLTAGSTARNETKPSTTALAFLPLGALLGLLVFRSRRRVSLGGLLMVLCFLGLSLGLSGCGGLNINGTPPGAYSFKVTASGMGTGITQSKDIALTVTQ
ncbi:Ig-like domain repeat protein [Granulicella sp. dw_53]|uniref:Ig-like domain repeat protein n=1 Tax=Granulicella sp. dw_53 TaxID=2719792 RepID=UPI001BD4CF00|nr:Ig-like domain repeat protein [Granulicella sp. dw_53]